jgi:hypothetical protein
MPVRTRVEVSDRDSRIYQPPPAPFTPPIVAGNHLRDRGRIPLIQQPEEEEVWLSAEIATYRTCRTALTMSVMGGKADIVLGRVEVRK